MKPDAVRSNFEVTARRSRVAAGRRKGQRNLVPVLREVLRQTVTVKRGEKPNA